MTEHQKQQIIRFLRDREVADTIRETIRDVFLKPREREVQLLAARMIAVEMLDEAFRLMENVKVAPQSEKKIKQVGL